MLRTAGLCVAIFLAAAGLTVSAQEQAADFYKGKTIHFIVGYGPGGGFDKYARMLAPHLEEKTGATVVVENRPGGSGMTAINQLARGKPDGLSIMLINGVPAAIGQITESPAVRFDLTKLSFLGRVAAEPWVLLVSAKSGYGSLDELVRASKEGKTLTFSGVGRADGPTDAAAVVCEALSLKCKMVVGFKGSKEAALAAIRGDVTGFAVTDRSARDYSQGDEVTPVAIIGRERSELLPDVPTIFDATTVPADKEFWIDFRGGIVDVGRALVTAPGTPEDRVAFLREAIGDVLTDQAVVGEGEKKGLPIAYASGADVQKTVKDVLGDLPENRLKAIRDVLLNKYF